MCLIDPFRVLLSWLFVHVSKFLGINNNVLQEQGYSEIIQEKMEENIPEAREILLELGKGQDAKGILFQIRKGDVVLLRPNSTLYGYKTKFFTELPEKGERFVRGKYRHVPVTSKLEASHSGSFHYYTLLDDTKKMDSEGYILVQPVLKLENTRIPLDCIQCVTYISKYLGKLSTWKEKLFVAHETNYNMVHFTPVQELGKSQSAYCLKDQLSVNSSFSDDGTSPNIQEISEIIQELKQEWKMLSICDIVLNHTANESPWLQKHPECAYNLDNSPHLRPAYLVDAALYQFSLDVAEDLHAMNGIPAAINCEDHLNALRHQLGSIIFPKLNIPEMFMVNTQELVDVFQERIRYAEPCRDTGLEEKLLEIQQDSAYRRLKSTVDLDLAIQMYNTFRNDCFDEDTRRRKCIEAFKTRLDNLNNGIKWQIESHLKAAIDNVLASVRYFRLEDGGPKIPKVTKKDLLVPRYFVEPKGANENSIYSDEAKYIMAHNGWMFNADPLKNFAEPGSNVYLRRELIAWGDSVKLRYGDKPEDCPFLWDHMKAYVEITASIFDGVRIDNCHSTPIPVAQYFLDAARLINSNLYVVAELFTDTERTDNIFVNKLGITSLIREAMSAWDSHELGRLVYRYGGDVIGAFGDPKPLKMAHAMFMDLTHDNPSPHDKRTVFDLLPSSALVSMASCCVGSTMGYDQLVPHHVDVVKETREYMNSSQASKTGGIMKAKASLNRLHFDLAKDGFNQIFVDQIDKDIVCVTRHNPTTLESVVLFSYTAFSWPKHDQNGDGKGVTVSGIATAAVIEAYLTHKSEDRFGKQAKFQKDSDIINGLDQYQVHVRENFSVERCVLLKAVPAGQSTRLNLTGDFKPGCVVAFRIVARKSAKEAAVKLHAPFDFSEGVRKLDFPSLNYALYRCEQEDEGTYNVPNHGYLVYCGLQGAMSVLHEVTKNDDLGHPLCGNIRDGSWLATYTANRLKKNPKLLLLGEMITQQMGHVDELPVSLRPWGTYRVLSQAHSALIQQALKLMPQFIREGNDFTQALALCSIQQAGIVRSSPLPPLSNSISPPHPDFEFDEQGNKKQICVTLAAGLPHFAAGYMRSWGRDTFISLRGLLLLTGRFNEARYHILAYGGCLRHGLIPNLLDGYGLKPRFNCRDAVWWWLHSIKEYVQLAPNGREIFKDKVNRLFPTDDSQVNFTEQELQAVMQEALSVHFQGLCFRERNAGQEIDEHMVSAGFDNQIGVYPTTGFVFGGNEWNCGTWMDKMGSSGQAGNRGRPATPRDGSPVEIIGLSLAVISWLDEIHIQGHYRFGGVSRLNKNGTTTTWTWSDWSSKIQESFEQEFWVGIYDQGQYVNRRGIYKDTVGATQPWADYRLRPNYLVSMVVAPQMFKKDNAKIALSMAKILEGPLGMKTLDPSDLAYRGDYDNNNHSNDYSTAHGFNYHQGPEWLWPVGYYLRAILKFSDDPLTTASEVEKILSRHWAHVESSHWRGLPELTNKGGRFCGGSCPTQAWSAATILETLMDIHLLRIKEEPYV